jgi:hypothetical protein
MLYMNKTNLELVRGGGFGWGRGGRVCGGAQSETRENRKEPKK